MEAEAVAVISASDTIPVKESVGVAVILSEKVAVRVTTSELDTILSESVSVRVTVGFIPEYISICQPEEDVEELVVPSVIEVNVQEETIKDPLNVAKAVPAVIFIKKAPIK